jgi:hypothetical protein
MRHTVIYSENRKKQCVCSEKVTEEKIILELTGMLKKWDVRVTDWVHVAQDVYQWRADCCEE